MNHYYIFYLAPITLTCMIRAIDVICIISSLKRFILLNYTYPIVIDPKKTEKQ